MEKTTVSKATPKKRTQEQLGRIDALDHEIDHLNTSLHLLNLASDSPDIDQPLNNTLCVISGDALQRIGKIREILDQMQKAA